MKQHLTEKKLILENIDIVTYQSLVIMDAVIFYVHSEVNK